MRNLSTSYEKATAYTEREKLPVGAYLLKIENVKYEDNSEKGYSDVITFMFDIVEGPQKDFFRKDYAAQTQEDKKWKGTYRLYVPTDDGSEKDEWTMKRFKTVMNNFEESNPGYHWNWDETTLKGKYIGGLFNEKEYEYNSKRGFFTNCHSLISRNKIATATIPDRTLLKNRKAPTDTNGFMDIPNDSVEELPFN